MLCASRFLIAFFVLRVTPQIKMNITSTVINTSTNGPATDEIIIINERELFEVGVAVVFGSNKKKH